MRFKDEPLFERVPHSVKELHSLFTKRGMGLFLVGGCVRDHIIGLEPKDFDLTTDALPDTVISLIGDRWSCDLQGKAFGVVRVFTEDCPEGIEIATFRTDLTTGRAPEVKLGVSIEDDVLRRDITFNAMFFDLGTKEIVDITGGTQDLSDGITRTVGHAKDRFEEDALRVLRTLRFTARLGHTLDKDISDAILDMDSTLVCGGQRISQERIWEEFVKSFEQCEGEKFVKFIDLVTVHGLLKEFFPGVQRSFKRFRKCTSLPVVLAQLIDDEKASKKLVEDCKVPTRVADQTGLLLSLRDLSRDMTPEFLDSLLRKRKSTHMETSVLCEWFKRLRKGDTELQQRFLTFTPEALAEELMSKGFAGPELGKEMRRITLEQFLEVEKK